MSVIGGGGGGGGGGMAGAAHFRAGHKPTQLSKLRLLFSFLWCSLFFRRV